MCTGGRVDRQVSAAVSGQVEFGEVPLRGDFLRGRILKELQGGRQYPAGLLARHLEAPLPEVRKELEHLFDAGLVSWTRGPGKRSHLWWAVTDKGRTTRLYDPPAPTGPGPVGRWFQRLLERLCS